MDLIGANLTQSLDQAVAAYQRYYGRPVTIEKLEHMLGSRRAAQGLMEEALERIHGTPKQKAAE